MEIQKLVTEIEEKLDKREMDLERVQRAVHRLRSQKEEAKLALKNPSLAYRSAFLRKKLGLSKKGGKIPKNFQKKEKVFSEKTHEMPLENSENPEKTPEKSTKRSLREKAFETFFGEGGDE